MITKLVLRNFKSIAEQTYEFKDFDLLVGRNNCGKSTILQAMAIWQFCVEEFRRAKRSGKTGKQVVLPNFTALPVPEFNLLWREKIDRRYRLVDGKRSTTPEYVLIEIEITWLSASGEPRTFGVQLRYNTPQAVYAIPMQGWGVFRDMEKEPDFPKIAYVPPFSGLEPTEEWRDDAPIRKQVGKAQPGSILRNLLYRVCPPPPRDEKGRIAKGYEQPPQWAELKERIQRWFSIELLEPKYERGVDTQILCEYKHGDKTYDIIAGGSGFHQALTLLAFLHGYKPTTILLDEPDAHMHVNLQREVLDYFKVKSQEQSGVQFLVATHAEELIKGVDSSRVVSILSQKPKRLTSISGVLTAMADVSNPELAQLSASPFVLYVEGESDERILRAWARTCHAEGEISGVCFHHMGGGTKDEMKRRADRHFEGVRQIVPHASRLVLFDYDTRDSFHPEPGNVVLYEWKRQNIENYLLVPPAWIRAAANQLRMTEDLLFLEPVRNTVNEFFAGQNLTLPPAKTWRTVTASIFEVVDGKRLLFEDEASLFKKLRSGNPSVEIIREIVAGNMTADEIHDDVWYFFDRLRRCAGDEPSSEAGE